MRMAMLKPMKIDAIITDEMSDQFMGELISQVARGEILEKRAVKIMSLLAKIRKADR